MHQYEFLTTWRVAAGIDQVWDAICRSDLWPVWWRSVESVRELEPGAVDGSGKVQRFVWRGALPYRLTMDIRTDRVEPLDLIQGTAIGDVEGTGTWRFDQHYGTTVVRYDWRVYASAGWLRTLSAVARPFVLWNHGIVMERGARGLAQRLGSTCDIEKSAF